MLKQGYQMGFFCPSFIAVVFCCSALLAMHLSSYPKGFCPRQRSHVIEVLATVQAADRIEQEPHREVDLPLLMASTNFSKEELLTLAKVLHEATFEDKRTVMVAPLNKAWAASGSMFDVFLEGLRSGEGTTFMKDHLVVFALDQAAYERCSSTLRHCFALRTEGVDFSQEQAYMKADYVKLTKRKMMFLRVVLELGFDFLFSDMDVLWFRPPFQHFSETADVNVACDKFNGKSTALSNKLNTGIMHARSNSRTRKLYEYWYQYQEAHPKLANQPSFHRFKNSLEFKAIGARISFMPTDYFGGFCQVASSSMDAVCTMHANCCKGLNNKLQALRMASEDWSLFKSMTPQEAREAGVHFRRLVCPKPKTCD